MSAPRAPPPPRAPPRPPPPAPPAAAPAPPPPPTAARAPPPPPPPPAAPVITEISPPSSPAAPLARPPPPEVPPARSPPAAPPARSPPPAAPPAAPVAAPPARPPPPPAPSATPARPPPAAPLATPERPPPEVPPSATPARLPPAVPPSAPPTRPPPAVPPSAPPTRPPPAVPPLAPQARPPPEFPAPAPPASHSPVPSIRGAPPGGPPPAPPSTAAPVPPLKTVKKPEATAVTIPTKSMSDLSISGRVTSSSSAGAVSTEFDNDSIRHGTLMKVNRDGKEESYRVALTAAGFSYAKEVLLGDREWKTLPLRTVLANNLEPEDVNTYGDCTFRLMSKQKSFLLRTKCVLDKESWVQDIMAAASEVQLSEFGQLIPESDTAPIWKAERSNCQLCNVSFGIFTRRHHCRNCGKCVCESCSREKCRVPKIDDRTLLKVCNDCARELKENRKYGNPH